MIDQRRFAPKGGRIKSESVAGYAGISNLVLNPLNTVFCYIFALFKLVKTDNRLALWEPIPLICLEN